MSQRQVETALLSVYDKTGLVEFARGLAELGIRLISSGGTAKALREAGLQVTSVDEITQWPEMLGGRVKTLHPKIHGGILADRDKADHQQDLAKHQIMPIDLVCVNLYPFVKVTSDPACTLPVAIENIDIGGPTMVRASAKNHKDVVIVTSPDQYAQVLDLLRGHDRRVDPSTRLKLALAAFRTTAEYDTYIQDFLADQIPAASDAAWPNKLLFTFAKTAEMRYGENPHQRAALYVDPKPVPGGWGGIKQLGGKELSFNNLVDANAAMELVMEFTEPAVAVIKHTNPAGVGVDADIVEAYRKAYLGDPNAAMGGIVAVNRPVEAELAEAIMASLQRWGKAAGAAAFFAEIVIAPRFSGEAIDVLATRKPWGKDVRILAVEGWAGTGPVPLPPDRLAGWDLKRLRGALLVQTRDELSLNESDWKVVSKAQPTPEMMKDIRGAWLVCKHVKSNAIVLFENGMLIGAGAGQMARVNSARLAKELAAGRGKHPVLASDAYFPFRDGVDQAAEAGVVAVIEPGGSKRDDEVIAAADEHGMVLIFTGTRHFRH